MSDEIPRRDEVILPDVNEHSIIFLDALMQALRIDRDMFPSDEEIKQAYSSLPQLLSEIPLELRDENLARMCVAVASGLFDGGINYAWNAAIIELRNKVRIFSFPAIKQITGKKFDEEKLLSLKDKGLLDLCLKLNLISEQGDFILNQCRDIRNNFSTAHPTRGRLDKNQFIHFVNSISKYALSSEKNVSAINMRELINAINANSFSAERRNSWCEKINNTYEVQRETIFEMLYGIYCDLNRELEVRENSIAICEHLRAKFTPSVRSLMINKHQNYQTKGKMDKHALSREFFERLELVDLLSEAEQHSIFSNACKRLLDAHNGANNFYNEPPFAEDLAKIAEGQDIPAATQAEFVETVLICTIGNGYGYSHAAYPYYEKMIQEFSNEEVQIMLELPEGNSVLAQRIKAHPNCKSNFANTVRLINAKSVTPQSKSYFDKWLKPQ